MLRCRRPRRYRCARLALVPGTIVSSGGGPPGSYNAFAPGRCRPLIGQTHAEPSCRWGHERQRNIR